MYHIWDVLNFTISATLVGLFLLLIKALFHDKLTARWHYFIWTVLLVRLLIPVQTSRISSPLSLLGSVRFNQWMALLQMQVEQRMHSVFSQPYAAIPGTGVSAEAMMQWQNYSLTDWLFVIYLAVAGLLALFYTIIYVQLRHRIRRGLPADNALKTLVQNTAAQYGVKPCRDIRICAGFDNPFVCGIIRPVLVIPAHLKDSVTDTMILHELLHLQYKDIWMNFVIHAVRILNWCNPLMWLILNRIQNDSEAFCDQRVLERIEQEQHKAYGHQLLDLARSKYPTVVGTTTMANGKRNIKRRLKRMVDFSRVPKGHGAAAFCITLLLTLSCVANASVPEPDFDTDNVTDTRSMERMLLNAQLYQTQTPEEAINIFCKALEDGNMGYMALVIPPDEWEAYEAWVWEMGKRGRHIEGGTAYSILLAEQAFGENGRPILNDDNTYLYVYGNMVLVHPYFFFEDGTLYRPIPRSNIDTCIIQNLYQIDDNTYRCQAIWDWHYDNENLESVYFDLAVEKTNDWNIRILDAQQVKNAAELQGVPDVLQPMGNDYYLNRWPVLAVQSYEDENYAITLQQYSHGSFNNLLWQYAWDPFGQNAGVPEFQRELDGDWTDVQMQLDLKRSLAWNSKVEVLMLPADDNPDSALKDIHELYERHSQLSHIESSTGSNQGWHYKVFRVQQTSAPYCIKLGGGGEGCWTLDELKKPYRVQIYIDDVLEADVVLEQEAMLYEE